MKNIFYLILALALLLVGNGCYFEFILSRENPLWLVGVTTFTSVILDGLGLWIIVKQVQKILKF